MTSDEQKWLITAERILHGDYDFADSSTRESLTIGLRSIKHELCQRALERLNVGEKPKTKKKK